MTLIKSRELDDSAMLKKRVKVRYTYHLESRSVRAGTEGIVMRVRNRVASVMFDGSVSDWIDVPLANLDACELPGKS